MKIPLLKFRHLLRDHSLSLDIYNDKFIDLFLTKNASKTDESIRIRLRASGSLFWCQYYVGDGIRHRPEDDGPSYCEWRSDGKISVIEYETASEINRLFTNGPAQYIWTSDGDLNKIFYVCNGKYHRPACDGPATLVWYDEHNKKKVTITFEENGYELGRRTVELD